MAYQDDKYENHFENFNPGRAAHLKFADFTVEATAAPGVPALIAARGAALRTARNAFRDDLTERIGAAGTSQAGTATEQEAFDNFKTFIQFYDAKGLNPYLYDRASQRSVYYPEGLEGLTQAGKKLRLTRLTAYTKALETADATLPQEDQLPDVPVAQGAPAGTQPQRPGAAARALLTAYETAADTRTKGRTTLKKEITDLTPTGHALNHALWGVHCAALGEHWEEPKRARQYFDYAGLPPRITRPGGNKSKGKSTGSK